MACIREKRYLMSLIAVVSLLTISHLRKISSAGGKWVGILASKGLLPPQIQLSQPLGWAQCEEESYK